MNYYSNFIKTGNFPTKKVLSVENQHKFLQLWILICLSLIVKVLVWTLETKTRFLLMKGHHLVNNQRPHDYFFTLIKLNLFSSTEWPKWFRYCRLWCSYKCKDRLFYQSSIQIYEYSIIEYITSYLWTRTNTIATNSGNVCSKSSAYWFPFNWKP